MWGIDEGCRPPGALCGVNEGARRQPADAGWGDDVRAGALWAAGRANERVQATAGGCGFGHVLTVSAADMKKFDYICLIISAEVMDRHAKHQDANAVVSDELIADRLNAVAFDAGDDLTMPDEPLRGIDLEEVVRTKMPKAHVPRWLMRLVGRLVRLDEINEILAGSDDRTGIDFLDLMTEHLNIRSEVVGLEHVSDTSRRYLFASNHPLGGLDGIIMLQQLSRLYDDKIRTFVNDILLYITPIRHYFMPVNKIGRQSRGLAGLTDRAYASDMQLLTFPAGACSRRINGRIQDLEWKKSFVQKAVEYERDIVPVYFEGRNSNFFYRLSQVRKRLGVRSNIEMILLAREMFNQRNASFRIIIGEPIAWQTFDQRLTARQWAAWVRDAAYGLAAK